MANGGDLFLAEAQDRKSLRDGHTEDGWAKGLL
jgi:hypothetical protein